MEMTMDDALDDKGRPIVEKVTRYTQTDSREGCGQDIVGDGVRALQGRLTVTLNTKSNKKYFRIVEQSDQLLPGIPDEITLNQIVPKMEWRVFHILSSVSHDWQQAIRNHQVHDARARLNSTETFVMIHSLQNEKVTLYSMRDKYCCELPRVPGPRLCGMGPHSSRWIALDGKLYVLGGVKEINHNRCGSREVYVLDLFGQREWKQCTSMEEGRYDFSCGVMDGKIYVFGGVDCRTRVRASEVYDPKENSWSEISHETFSRYDPQVAVLGEELILYDGRPPVVESFDDDYCVDDDDDDDDRCCETCPNPSVSWNVYHPVKDVWNIVRPFSREYGWGRVFMSKGKFYVMTADDLDARIEVYDYAKNTWSHLHSSSLAGIAGTNDCSAFYNMMVVNDELLVAVCNYDSRSDLLLRSNGFGSAKKEILWTVENRSLAGDLFLLCSVEL